MIGQYVLRQRYMVETLSRYNVENVYDDQSL